MGMAIKKSTLLLTGMVVFIMLGVLYSPYTPCGKEGLCERELSNLHGILGYDTNIMGCAFNVWRTNISNSAQQISTIELMSKYCLEFSLRRGDRIFSFDNKDGFMCLVDPWGRPYNVDVVAGLDASLVNSSITNFAIGGFVIWSSGPNGINEHGVGDDILEVPLRYLKGVEMQDILDRVCNEEDGTSSKVD